MPAMPEAFPDSASFLTLSMWFPSSFWKSGHICSLSEMRHDSIACVGQDPLDLAVSCSVSESLSRIMLRMDRQPGLDCVRSVVTKFCKRPQSMPRSRFQKVRTHLGILQIRLEDLLPHRLGDVMPCPVRPLATARRERVVVRRKALPVR